MSLRSIPSSVVALGFVSLFMDVSSEMIHSLLPVFLVSVLGASALSVGFIEGIAEATAAITKIFSGVVSDWMGRRKPLLLLGYGMAALTKPVFPLADTLASVLLARFLDRIGKGVRGAPRDALVAEVTPPDLRGAAFGLRQSMDTVGAFAGPAIAMLLMVLSGDDFRLVFWIAVLPAFVAVAVILFGVREPDTQPSTEPRRFPIQRSQLRRLDATFWSVVALASVLTLARFSEAFLLLRAQSVGMENAYAPLVLIVMNVVYAVSAYPLGRLADRMNRRRLLALGVGFLVLADLVLAAAGSAWVVLAGAALWGLHMGSTQGLLAVFVADATPADLRGTGFGLYNLMTGLALLIASTVAGVLWTVVGPDATFLVGAAVSLIALVGLSCVVQRQAKA
ncbi:MULTISPECIES: MFS transporter [unclassified Azospirillum]|uniref:MFS transporter n=2 Tax=unclassified Azospirillum TaxID=2630922 RepID=UPI000D61E0FF|nr:MULTISPECIES: MFS transporter [unclassified Azospirillum]PWC91095.1 MFS transporter [Azospirillum sp. TSO5]